MADATPTAWQGLKYLLIVVATYITIRLYDKVMCSRRVRAMEGRVSGPKESATAAEPAREEERWQFVDEYESVDDEPRPPNTSESIVVHTDSKVLKDKQSQAQCTYTSVRGSNHPRFYALPEHSHG